MDTIETLSAEGLQHFLLLQADAVDEVSERFYTEHGAFYEKFGSRGRDFTRQDIAFHLEFLRPVLEFGMLRPMVDYLCWLGSVLVARGIPLDHLALSLDWLAEFFAGQMAVAEGALVAAALRTARTSFLATGQALPLPPMPPAPWAAAIAFEAALLAGEQRQASAVVNRLLDDGHGLVDVELHVVQPALYAIGEKWQTNLVSVAQEHMATAIAQSVMTEGLLRSPPPVPNHKRALLACVEGNNHAVGLRMVADALLLAGWEVQHLGANVPTLALVRHAAEWQPDLIGLSVSFAHQVQAVRAVIAQLDERLGSARPAVIMGGLAVNRFNAMVGLVGADASTVDAQTAVICANRVVSGGAIR
jgi:methanogenic corrinoid protein MtbC1